PARPSRSGQVIGWTWIVLRKWGIDDSTVALPPKQRACRVCRSRGDEAVTATSGWRDQGVDGVVDEGLELGVLAETRHAQLQRKLQEAGVDAVREQGAVARLLAVEADLAEGAGQEV